MSVISSLVVNLVANTSQFSSGLKKGEAEAKRFQSVMRGVSRALDVVGVSLSAVAAANFLKGTLEEATDAENTFKKLATAVKSTGMVAGFTANQLSDMATELQKTTTFADDTTKKAQALLLTFTNVRGGIFAAGIKSAQDMSIALGVDLTDAVRTVGKALNDPARGLMLLQRAGASFTDEQIKIIKESKKTGDSLKAQTAILEVLAKMYGGQAAAAVETLTGKVDQLNNRWADFKEAFGEKVTSPALNDLLNLLNYASEKGSAFDRLEQFFSRIAIGAPPGWAPEPRPAAALSGASSPSRAALMRGRGFDAAGFGKAINAPWKQTGFIDFNAQEKLKAQAVRDAMDIQSRFGLQIGMAVGLGVLGAGGMGKEDWLTRGARPRSASGFTGSSELATNFSRGSVGDYLARTTNGPMVELTAIAKKQLDQQTRAADALAKWDPFGGQPFPQTVTIGS